MSGQDDILKEIFVTNTAQSVQKYLNDLESNRANNTTRWIWELLQNARDASLYSDSLIVSIKHEEHEKSHLIFEHTGAKFTKKQIGHLIFHGSTKVDKEEAIGQYGSGFLTTYMLSPEVEISGILDDGTPFLFNLEREIDSLDKLIKSMYRAWEKFNECKPHPLVIKDGFTTRFKYPIERDNSPSVVEQGLREFKRCAPYVMAFNREFSKINIETSEGILNFTKVGETELDVGLSEVIIEECENGNRKNLSYLLSERKRTTVAVSLESQNKTKKISSITDVPRLFLGFPLIGTEKFNFPAVINSFKFSPTEGRDGVYLNQGENDENIGNGEIIKESCELLVNLISFAANLHWHNICALATVPEIVEQKWMDSKWVKQTIAKFLVEKIRQTPVVVTEFGDVRAPCDANFSMAEDDTVDSLWNLLTGLREKANILPRQGEAMGWCRAVKSWADICGQEVSEFDESVDGKKLSKNIDKKTKTNESYGTVKNIEDILQNIHAIEWLDKLHDFIGKSGLRHSVSEFHIVPDQAEFLDKLSNLHCDENIDDELKNIAELLDWKIRAKLRDVKIISLKNEIGSGCWNNDDIVTHVIAKLKERADNNRDGNFLSASTLLFSWIVKKEKWKLLRDYPAFSRGSDPSTRQIIKLEQTEQCDDMPLSPVATWPEDLQEYATLFPEKFILGDEFYDAIDDSTVWQQLYEQKFVRNNVIFRRKTNFRQFLPDESQLDKEKDHITNNPVDITEVVFLSKTDVGIMHRVRKSKPLALLFWKFLTEWLIEKNSDGLVVKEASCACGDTHRYYSAGWIGKLIGNQWIPRENNKVDRISSESLASFLQNNEHEKNYFLDNDCNENVNKFLTAIRVTRLDLVKELMCPNQEDSTKADIIFTNLLTSAGGDIDLLGCAQQYITDLKNDADLPGVLEKRREDRKSVYRNQQVGKQVEMLVKESLELVGFSVAYTGIGSDFEISTDVDTAGQLELASGNSIWLVEVKATRRGNIHMTKMQAKTAVEKKERYILCVVPIDPGEDSPESETVQKNMRFVVNIGFFVGQSFDELDEFNKLRDKITTEKSPGIQLVVNDGEARFQVSRTLWEGEGFDLVQLVSRLT